jgi:Tol biopolymer transport system component/tRNA A-37 threonylcarbamoyl transferase component Bud32
MNADGVNFERLSRALADRYAIERELGQGGMATVYLARDLKHDRHVAVKVLHPDLAAVVGAARFLAEIRTTANLQHPHILPLHDSGDADGYLFYVMPYVDGETLRTRLTRERQLPISDAVRIAREVASALDYAHRHGVIHRDVKPENVLLHDGSALVADFGIALAVQQARGVRMTQTGLSLGTPQYMSPEQAMGEKNIDARSDIYALGAVAYEMLVGEPPFTGPSVQAIVARLVTEEPRSITVQRKAVPPDVEAAVLHALEKLPADRFTNAAQFADALEGRGPVIGTHASTRAGVTATTRSAGGTRRGRRFEIAAAIALGAVILAGGAWFHARGAGEQPVERRYVALGDAVQVASNQNVGSPFALSPDGSLLAFVGDTLDRIWIKHREILDPTPIAGTEHASDPVFSPDGKWIAYIADGQLKKIRVDGGPSTTLADSAGEGFGVAWLDDGTLVYTTASQLGLRRVAATGGAVSIALADSVLHGNGALLPTALPQSRGVLFEDCTSNCATTSLHVLDLKTGKQKKLIDGVRMGWYLPNGELLYMGTDGVANAVPFDLDRLATGGASIPVLQGVSILDNRVKLAWSPSGKLVYEVANASADAVSLAYANRAGAMTNADPGWTGQFNSFAISPDGHRAAVSVTTPGAGIDIWIKQLDTGPFTRLTFGGHDRRPTWSPDGREVAFVRDNASGSGADVYAHAADGAGTDRRLVHLDRTIQEVTWSHDGRWLLVRTDNSQAGNGDIVALSTLGASAPVPVATSRFTELQPALSPDERWVAYVSNDAGRNEVYVSPFPAGSGSHWQISNGGGGSPAWSPDGRQLYFLDAANRLIAAQVATDPTFHVTALTPLFNATRFNYIAYHQAFAVMPDGRFAFIDQPRQSTTNAVRLVQIDNWFADLKTKLKQ